jgi:hypothetical protein
MRYALAMLLLVHGFAHTVGFVVPWKIASLEEAPYKTTILYDKLDLGHIGIRLMGLLWLLAAIAFFAAGALVIARIGMWQPLTLGVAVWSLILCVLGLPESRIGIAVNVVILVFVIMGARLGWLESLGV